MSELDVELVQTALRLLEIRAVAVSEAARMLALAGSREEFLAHLLLRRDSLSPYLDITSAIRRVASSGGREPATPRRHYEDLGSSRQAYIELEDRLKTVIAGASRSQAIFTDTESAMRIFSNRVAADSPPRPKTRSTVAAAGPLAIAAQ